MRQHLRYLAVCAAIGWLSSATLPAALGQEPAGDAQNKAAVQAAGQAYVRALEAGDAEALISSWTSDGDFVDESGRPANAREMIRREFSGTTETKRDIHIKVEKRVIRFPAENVAIEDGLTFTKSAGSGPPAAGRYTAVWIEQDGKWLLDCLRELQIDRKSNYEHLAPLAWLAGDWVGEADGMTAEIDAEWTLGHNFLLLRFTMRPDGGEAMSGVSRIGYDAQAKRIRSWFFDSQGGHGEGKWTDTGNSWVVVATQALADGRTTKSTHVYILDGPDRFTWKSMDVSAGNAPLPTAAIQFVRKRDAQ